MDRDSRRVAGDLQQWAKMMGFVPGSKFASTEEFPSVETFQKICKGKTIKLWQDIMAQTRPKEEILHIQKNLLLQRLRSGLPLDKNPVPGHLSRQIVLTSKVASKENERDDLLKSLHETEMSIRAKEKSLRKSGHKIAELQSQVDELKKKTLLFKIKSEECRSTLNYYNDIVGTTNEICPPPPNAKPFTCKPTDTAEAVLYKCLDVLREFHAKGSGAVIENSEDQAERLQALWKQIKANIKGWGAQQLWDAINSQLLGELMEEMTSLCGDEDKTMRTPESQASFVAKAMSILPAKHLSSVLEYIKMDTKTRIKALELNKLKEKLIENLEGLKLNSSSLNRTMINTPDITKDWVEAQSKKAELSGKLQAIKAELANWKESSPCLAAATADLKVASEELAKLDLQVNLDKSQIEENLGHMRNIAERLTSAHTKALEQRRNFNSQVPLFLQKSKSHRFYSEDSCSPNERKLPLSSTMIGNVTADSNLSFETTCDSITDKFGGQSNLSELVLAIRESVSKEAKLFIKVQMETVPFIICNGRREPMSNLLVQAPKMTSHSTSLPQKNFLQIVRGTPFSSAPKIILDQLHAASHVRALNLYKFLNELSCPSDLQASINLGAMRKQIPKQEATVHEEIEGVNSSLGSIDLLLSRTKTNLDFWIERPLQKTVSALSLSVGGYTFEEWCKKYDELSK